jgi:hypothetical protein
MNEEQTKRLAEAAEAFWQASELLMEAAEATCDARFEKDAERERIAAGQLMLSKLDNASKRIEDALKKSVVAAAACGRPGAWDLAREGLDELRAARRITGEARDTDGSGNKRDKARVAVASLTNAMQAMQQLVFVPGP